MTACTNTNLDSEPSSAWQSLPRHAAHIEHRTDAPARQPWLSSRDEATDGRRVAAAGGTWRINTGALDTNGWRLALVGHRCWGWARWDLCAARSYTARRSRYEQESV